MQSILRISDAAAIAIHAADYLAAKKDPLVPAMEITRALDISYNHLSKVLQQLTRAGLLTAARGPKGGFSLSQAGKKARVRDFIAAIDGLPPAGDCLLKHKVCLHRNCVLGNFLSETNERFKAVLDRKISDFRDLQGRRR
ncbi:MAG: Rrf2 family transcriptional regulator [Elusimicrobia bacterium]|nr:Rrf2 family transcriptional regulator [Elusimicrobiota bacterium]